MVCIAPLDYRKKDYTINIYFRLDATGRFILLFERKHLNVIYQLFRCGIGMYQTIFYKFRKMLVKLTKVRKSKITINTYFQNDLGMSDQELVKLSKIIEKEFDIFMPENILYEFNTVGEIVGFIEQEIGR
jgi:acyl carrier protein